MYQRDQTCTCIFATLAVLHTRFNFFRAVVADGRHIDNVEMQVGPFFSKWLPQLLNSPVKKDALKVTTNLVKFHSSFTGNTVTSVYVK